MDKMKHMNEKEEKKGVKSFLKKHRSKIALGIVTVGGFCLSRYAYKLGYDNGHYDGYDKGFKECAEFTNIEINKVETF